ncbi:SDR family NAD(P)-dependent oxidoreductase [Conexibacter sp. CPCC 206217]|uniref:SDR family NAD(P)-dependent oxidoreductase n=1 Tax=Conexibacter sp. CPCC 206217 TaxID=3064574 RepID=UPI0027218FFE|nr:SDR family NAD(P)-dependent oxidoreductase [Conexibacter sp. CPCC 206217]MDO8210376.1 SDR family NAD(P)-dependent oxidoreductase [Conexibacter sp. CPCC 206217]
MTQQSQQVWFVTGVSRGLGEALARELLRRGHHVVGTTRDGSAPASLAENPRTLAGGAPGAIASADAAPARFDAVALDVTDPAQAAVAVQRAHAVHGRLDVVVNNAGYGLLGTVEGASADEVAHLFEVNFFGPLRVMQAALPLLREQRGGGHVVNVISIAALAPGAGSGLYAAAKAALRGVSQALAQEAGPLGIGVTIVAPGQFRTDFLSDHSIRSTARTLDAYAPTAGAVLGRFAGIAGTQTGDPAKAAVAMIDAVQSSNPPVDLVLGADALDRARADAERLRQDMRDWEQVSRATAFGDEAAAA